MECLYSYDMMNVPSLNYNSTTVNKIAHDWFKIWNPSTSTGRFCSPPINQVEFRWVFPYWHNHLWQACLLASPIPCWAFPGWASKLRVAGCGSWEGNSCWWDMKDGKNGIWFMNITGKTWPKLLHHDFLLSHVVHHKLLYLIKFIYFHDIILHLHRTKSPFKSPKKKKTKSHLHLCRFLLWKFKDQFHRKIWEVRKPCGATF